MNKCPVWISCLVLCLACTPEDKKIPDDILPIDKMKTLVWELTQAGEYAARQKQKDSTIQSLNTMYFSQVLAIYHVDKNTFVRSFDFYQAHPLLNKVLFDSVSAYATRQRVELYRKTE